MSWAWHASIRTSLDSNWHSSVSSGHVIEFMNCHSPQHSTQQLLFVGLDCGNKKYEHAPTYLTIASFRAKHMTNILRLPVKTPSFFTTRITIFDQLYRWKHDKIVNTSKHEDYPVRWWQFNELFSYARVRWTKNRQ